MNDLPIHITITFWVTTFATLILFHWAASNMKEDRYKSNLVLMGLTGWLIIQSILAQENLYSGYLDTLPPWIMITGILPTLFVILLLFISKSGRYFIDQLPLKQLTYLHIVRIPVELVLYWLMLENTLPEVMTFKGFNFDIMAGISAPFVAYFFVGNSQKFRTLLIIWNLLCLGLLINIVTTAFLAAPTPLQQIAFDQANIAVLFFPYIWLPTFIVPIVLFSHLVSLRKLVVKKI